jgi:hypothetical protein
MKYKSAKIALRLSLSATIAFGTAGSGFGAILPAGLAVNSPAVQQQDDNDPLAPILAALNDIPARQTVDNPNPGNTSSSDSTGSEKPDKPDIGLTNLLTKKIVRDLRSITKECSNYDDVYRIDCLRQGIDLIVQSLPEHSAYDDAKKILRKASRRLGNIVGNYEDPSAPKLVAPPGANPRFLRRRSYTAIKREAVPEAMAKATAVVEEASTRLLRSSENSDARLAHYQEISVAVDSTKVLLRSS